MSDSALTIATSTLLDSSGLTLSTVDQVLGILHTPHTDYSELYFQANQVESWSMENGIIKSGSFNTDKGVGVRAVSGDKTGFSFCENFTDQHLISAAKAANAIAQSGQTGIKRIVNAAPQVQPALYSQDNPISLWSSDRKVELLKQIDQKARAIDPRVKQVMCSLVGSYSTVLIVSSDGTYAADIRPLIRLSISVVAESGGRRETGSSGVGGRTHYELFVQNDVWERHTEEAVRIALINLEAQPMPAGVMDVVLGPGWPGVLLHEAIGHGLEADFNRKKTSAFSDKLGQKVANEACTIVDNGTLLNRRGSLSIDDEGVASQNTVLIENGILKNYMQDKLNARLMGMEPTGNGRRESYACLPMPRMTNTYMLPGQYKHDEIIHSVKDGLYAVNFSGGQVDITSGKFVFVTNEAYLIENGKITTPVKGATLVGDGPTVLHQVSMVGDNLKLDEGIGTCGKDGQSVPVGVGQPTLLVNDLTVGGTNT